MLPNFKKIYMRTRPFEDTARDRDPASSLRVNKLPLGGSTSYLKISFPDKYNINMQSQEKK